MEKLYQGVNLGETFASIAAAIASRGSIDRVSLCEPRLATNTA